MKRKNNKKAQSHFSEYIRNLKTMMNEKAFIGLKQYSIGTAFGAQIEFWQNFQLNWVHVFGALLFGGALRTYSIRCTGSGKHVFVITPIENAKKREMISRVKEFSSESREIFAYPRYGLDFRGFLIMLYYPIWFLQMSHLHLGVKEKLIYVGNLGMCKKWLYKFSRELDKTPTVLVTTFCDHFIYDNITAQYCREKGIKTVTLQHGVYPPSSKIIYSGGFESFVSDTLLVWSEQSREAAIQSGIAIERIYIAGMLTEEIEKEFNPPDAPIFGVVLSGETNNVEIINTELIKTANDLALKLGYRYIIKPHPYGPYTYAHLYQDGLLEMVCDKSVSMWDLARKVHFSICVSISSGAFDLMRMGAASFIHDNQTEENYFLYSDRLCFKTADELIERIKWSENYKGEYKNETNRVVRYVYGENNEQAYREFYEQYL